MLSKLRDRVRRCTVQTKSLPWQDTSGMTVFKTGGPPPFRPHLWFSSLAWGPAFRAPAFERRDRLLCHEGSAHREH